MYAHRHRNRSTLLALVVASAALTLVTVGITQTAPSLGQPTNLEAVSVTGDTITLAWGPSQPGPFSAWDESKRGDKVWIHWEPSTDTRGTVTHYSVWKNGTLLNSVVTQAAYQVTGLNRRVKSFVICVQAFNFKNQGSPQGCATFNRP